MEKSSKDLQFLNTARDYRRWRLWFTYYVKGLGLEEHLTEVAVPTEAESRKKFLKERSQLLATVFRCVGLRFTPLIEGKTTVAEMHLTKISPLQNLKKLKISRESSINYNLKMIQRDCLLTLGV